MSSVNFKCTYHTDLYKIQLIAIVTSLFAGAKSSGMATNLDEAVYLVFADASNEHYRSIHTVQMLLC